VSGHGSDMEDRTEIGHRKDLNRLGARMKGRWLKTGPTGETGPQGCSERGRR